MGPSFYARGLAFSLSERRDGGQIRIFVSRPNIHGHLTALIDLSLIRLLVSLPAARRCLFSVVRFRCFNNPVLEGYRAKTDSTANDISFVSFRPGANNERRLTCT